MNSAGPCAHSPHRPQGHLLSLASKTTALLRARAAVQMNNFLFDQINLYSLQRRALTCPAQIRESHFRVIVTSHITEFSVAANPTHITVRPLFLLAQRGRMFSVSQRTHGFCLNPSEIRREVSIRHGRNHLLCHADVLTLAYCRPADECLQCRCVRATFGPEACGKPRSGCSIPCVIKFCCCSKDFPSPAVCPVVSGAPRRLPLRLAARSRRGFSSVRRAVLRSHGWEALRLAAVMTSFVCARTVGRS